MNGAPVVSRTRSGGRYGRRRNAVLAVVVGLVAAGGALTLTDSRVTDEHG